MRKENFRLQLITNISQLPLGSSPAIPAVHLFFLVFPRTFENRCNDGGNDQNQTNAYRSPSLCVTPFDPTPTGLALAPLAATSFRDLNDQGPHSLNEKLNGVRKRQLPVCRAIPSALRFSTLRHTVKCSHPASPTRFKVMISCSSGKSSTRR